jgi:hypothetical protein
MTDAVKTSNSKFRRWYGRGVVAGLIALVVLDVAALAVYVRDTKELAAIAARVSADAATPSEKMRKLADYVAHDVKPGRPDKYLLLPIFKPLRPTAMQVIQYGGDCSYKARAFIVLARRLGISAHKVALHDPKGEPVHAVAVVDTERGEYVVDLLYGIIYDNADGTPIPLSDLQKDPELLASVIAERVRQGSLREGKYPLDKYVYSDVKSFNWKQNALASACYRGLAPLVGSERLDRLPRPYFESEPALLVLIGSGLGALVLVSPLAVMRYVDRRRAARAKAVVEKPVASAG